MGAWSQSQDCQNDSTASGVALEVAITGTWTAIQAREFGFDKSTLIKSEGNPWHTRKLRLSLRSKEGERTRRKRGRARGGHVYLIQ